MGPERVELNRFYRAVHDEVCPRCGGHIKDQFGMYLLCASCGLIVNHEEMQALAKLIIPDWGKKPLEAFLRWRAAR